MDNCRADRNLTVGIGEILWDILPEGRKLGGAPANFAFHMSQFGYSSMLVSAVGNDSLGDGIIQRMEQTGTACMIMRTDYPTGTVRVELDGNGIPQYRIAENTAWDNIPLTAELIRTAAETKAVCFGSLAQRSPVSRRTINAFLDAVPDGKGTYKVFDINLRQHFYTEEVLEESMRRCNVLKINEDELEILKGICGLQGIPAEKASRTLIERYSLDILVLTCGSSGSSVFTADCFSHMETPAVKVADTVGAGDSFTAAFTAALMDGCSISEAHRLAVDVSAYVCTQAGATPILPSSLTSRVSCARQGTLTGIRR